MGSGTKWGHLTEDQRYSIWRLLGQGLNFKEIGEAIGKDATTVSKEVKNHRYLKPAKEHGDIRDHQCRLAASCGKRGICDNKECRIPCRKCLHCHRHCAEFAPRVCDAWSRPPYVCNGCEKRLYNRCKEDKYFYGHEQAHKEYRRTLRESREGIDRTRDEIAAIEGLVAPLIKKGQPVNHIYARHGGEIGVSKRTFYRYVHDGDIGIKGIDLRRAVRYRPRKRARAPKPTPGRKTGHTYDCFLAYVAENPRVRVTETDTVEGRKGGKLLMTMFMRDVDIMLVFLIDSKGMANTVGVVDSIEGAIGTEAFSEAFPLLLADNGTEFSDPVKFEVNAGSVARTKMFYAEPYHTNQKSRIEKCHEFIRYVYPKGTSFDSLSQEDALSLANNINSVARDALGGKSPFDLALEKGLGPILEKLGMGPVPHDEVDLAVRRHIKNK